MKYRFALRKIRSKQCIWWICAPSSGYLTAADYQVIGSQVESSVAAKLARLVYRMLRHGMKYVDLGAALYEALNIGKYKSSISSGKPPSSDTKLSKPLQHKAEFLESHRCYFIKSCRSWALAEENQQSPDETWRTTSPLLFTFNPQFAAIHRLSRDIFVTVMDSTS